MRIAVDCAEWREHAFRAEREDVGSTLITWFDTRGNEARMPALRGVSGLAGAESAWLHA